MIIKNIFIVWKIKLGMKLASSIKSLMELKAIVQLFKPKMFWKLSQLTITLRCKTLKIKFWNKN